MPVTLTPDEVDELTRREVTSSDITDAANLIEYDTGWTCDEHVDDRLIPSGMVQRAWAIVAARLALTSTEVGAEAVSSEAQGDYSASSDPVMAEGYAEDPLRGAPRALLRVSTVRSAHVRPGGAVYVL